MMSEILIMPQERSLNDPSLSELHEITYRSVTLARTLPQEGSFCFACILHSMVSLGIKRLHRYSAEISTALVDLDINAVHILDICVL